MAAADFTFRDGERVIRFGADALADAPEGGFALLTTARALGELPWLADRAEIVLDIQPGGVPEAAAAVRPEVGGRPIVALGGGRVIDAAKAIAGADGIAALTAIPTTLSGAPFTPLHRMPAGYEGWAFKRPSLVLADPAQMASQPMPHLAASAMNALAHACESLYMPFTNPISQLAAARAAEGFQRALEPEQPDREELALSAFLAGYAIGVSGLGFHHALCQTIVRVAGTPHAETNAVMLPHTMAFVRTRAPDVLEPIEGVDLPTVAARAGVTSLSQLGLGAGALPALAEAALAHPALANLPGGAPSREQLDALLLAAL